MFGLFKRKLPLQPTVTPEDKKWVEENIEWMIKAFSLSRIKDHPFLLSPDEITSSSSITDTDQLMLILNKLCSRWELDPGSISLKLFDDILSKQWTTPLVPDTVGKWAAGMYEHLYSGDVKLYNIHIAQSNLKSTYLSIAILAHEIAHVKLLGGNLVSQQDPGMEALTDLTCIYFGFGIFIANTCQYQEGNSINRLGYLSNEVISYANALVCYITNYDPALVTAHLNINTKELFDQDYHYLQATHDTRLTKAVLTKNEQLFILYEQVNQGFKEKNFDKVLKAYNLLLAQGEDAALAYNGIGYALLGKKEYRSAIEAFTKSIDKAPFWAYPYNNRGYCRLQLGELEEAFPDLHSSWEMDPGNSFNWRNLGIYYCLVNETGKAIEYLNQAEKLDPNTEMINFYFGLVHEKAGDTEQACVYYNRSKEREEFNDSVFAAEKN